MVSWAGIIALLNSVGIHSLLMETSINPPTANRFFVSKSLMESRDLHMLSPPIPPLVENQWHMALSGGDTG